MSQPDTRSSGPTDVVRFEHLNACMGAVEELLKEKERSYGRAGGFYDTNQNGDYSHAIGEATLKLKEFAKTKQTRYLIKAIAWAYLIYETEALRGPRKD